MRIAVFHGGDTFIRPIAEDWIKKGHDVRICPNVYYWDNWKPELIWFEFCTSNIVFYSKNMQHDVPVICRLHGVGVRLNIYKAVNWSKVDHAIFVSDHLKNEADLSYFKDTQVHLVNNGVNLDEFTLKKDFTPTYKLAYVGFPNDAKGYPELPFIVEKFKEINPRYELHEAIPKPKDPRYVPHDLMNYWLEDKDYLIHPSKRESFCFAVAEAMAKGIRPLIGNWPGAAETFGNEFFIDKFNLEQDPIRIRKIIEEKYNIKDKIREINSICHL